MFVAFLPFPTAVMSEYYTLSYSVCFYAITFAALASSAIASDLPMNVQTDFTRIWF